MFDVCQKPAGIDYTKLVALLAVGLIFTPAALVYFSPVGNPILFLGIACSVGCLALAVLSWRKPSGPRAGGDSR